MNPGIYLLNTRDLDLNPGYPGSRNPKIQIGSQILEADESSGVCRGGGKGWVHTTDIENGGL
eukprot:304345-Amorphochlora_amoeboformis.AAC.1